MLKSFETKIFGASRKMCYISAFALAIMMCLVFVNVLSRIVWRPLLGTYEFTALLASVTVSFALANCAAEKGHVAISLFTDRLSTKAQGIFGTLVAAIGFCLFAVLSWQCVIYAILIKRSGEVSFTTEVPFFPFILGIAFGFLMLALVNLVDLFTSISKVAKR